MYIKSLFRNFIVLSIFVIGSAYAATITVDGADGSIDPNDGFCSISEAIINANDGAQTHADCAAGSGADTIELTSDIILTEQYDNDTSQFGVGRTGTPAISSIIILDGGGFSLVRDASLGCTLNGDANADEFRLMRTLSSGNLDLRNISLSYGCIDGDVSSSRSKTGGGIYNDGTLSVNNSYFSENEARFNGGGIDNSNTIITIQNSTFSDNSVRSDGGGIYNRDTITTIQNSTFSNNSADSSGGGIYSRGTISNIENSTFSGNSASLWGGGIYNMDTITTIENSTFYGNSADIEGSGIYNDFGTITTLRNSLFNNNSGSSDCGNDGGGTLNGSNNLADNLSAGCPGLISTALSSSTVGPLANNGGPTLTHALLPGSEALDAGDTNSTATDQRGFSAFNSRDIGAFEAQAIEQCPTALQTDGFITTVADADELIQAIECANLNGDANGGDTIQLGSDITLTEQYDNDTSQSGVGRTGTPAISSTIILDGGGFSLVRDASLGCTLNGDANAGEFRLLRTVSSGNLDLRNITLSHGCIDGDVFGYPSKSGGGIYNDGTLSVNNSYFSENQARFDGGGIYNDYYAKITTIQNSTFSENSAGSGASIYNSASITTIQNSTFSNNSADSSGGGVYSRGTISNIENSTFSGNSASLWGGGIYNMDTITTIENSTFYGNSADIEGSGIYNDFGTITTLRNSLFNNNSGSSDCGNDGGGTLNGSNNLSDDASSGCPGLLSTVLTSSTVGPLTDNGGPTLTHALLPGSEALNAGDNDSTATDQRGFAASGIRDIGAFEAQPPIVVAPADVNVEATGLLTSPALGTATVTDAEEPGLIATPSITDNFPLGLTIVTWSVTDSYGFNGTDTQDVTIVDTTPPVITILGSNPVQLNIGDAYTDVGATAVDIVDGAVAPVISGSVNTSVAGSYNIPYQATDNQGNSSQAIRVVNVGVVRSFTGALDSGNTGTLSFTTNDQNCSFISTPQFLDASSVTPAPPSQLIFLDGVVSFTIDNCASGATVDMTMDYNQTISPQHSYWKSGSPWFEIPSTISGTAVSFSITDGGVGDADGSVDGSITDPSGLAATRAAATPVPAGQWWTWLLLIGLVIGVMSRYTVKDR